MKLLRCAAACIAAMLLCSASWAAAPDDVDSFSSLRTRAGSKPTIALAWHTNAAGSTGMAASHPTSMAPAINAFPYFQDFNGAWPPAGWSVIDNAGGGGVWHLNTTWGRPNYAGGDGTCAAADSQAFRTSMNTELRAVFDFSGLTKPVLQFVTSYRDLGATDSARTLISTNGGTSWVTLANWTNNISPFGPGSNIVFDLQPFAGQPNVILRFWYYSGWDWWWQVDNVLVLDKLPNVYLEPLRQIGSAYLGERVPFRLTVENASGAAREFNFAYDSAWPVTGPSASGLLNDNTTTSITVQVAIPPDVFAGQACTTTIHAVSTDGVCTNSALMITSAAWYKRLFYEPFDGNPFTNGWVQYHLGAPTGWVWYTGFGNPEPCMRHDTLFRHCTNWLVSPAIMLTGTFESLTLMFDEYNFHPNNYDPPYAGVFISTGARDPRSNDYVLIEQFGARWGDWATASHTLTPYLGQQQVYLGFLYVGCTNSREYLDNISITGWKVGINNAMLLGPAALPPMTSYANTPAITGALYAAGESGTNGPAPYTIAQIGFGPQGMAPNDANWTWYPATYLGADGDYDLYHATPAITIAGSLNYCYRFRRGEGPWVYADLDGSSNEIQSNQLGTVTVAQLPPKGVLLHHQTISLNWVHGPLSCVNLGNVPPHYWETADDFRLPSDAYLTSVRMGGMYWNAGRQGLEQGFWLRIYGHAVTNPGAMLYEQYVPGYACEQFIGVDGAPPNDYLYHVDLATPLFVQAGNTYWLSLQQEVRKSTYWSVLDTPDAVRGRGACQRVAVGGAWLPMISMDLGMEIYGDVTNAGTINGTVRDAKSLAPLAAAQVVITNAGYFNSVLTDSNGFYSTPAPPGTYQLVVTKAKYLPATAQGVAVTVGATTTMDFLLEGSHLFVTPTNVTRSMALGQQTVNTLTLSNTGPLTVNYRVRISNFGAVTTVAAHITRVSLPPSDGTFPRGTAPLSAGRAPHSAAPATLAVPVAAAAPPRAVRAYGFNVYPVFPNALMTFMTDNPTGVTTIGSANTGPSGFVCGAAFLNRDFTRLYCLVFGDNRLVQVNTADATVTLVGACTPASGESWTGLAADPVSGTLYASAYGTVSRLYRINPATGAATAVAPITGSTLIIGIAINANGEMYGLDIGTDTLVRINKATGAATTVGSIGYDANYAQDLAFDLENDVLYVAAYNNVTRRGELRLADISTGNTTLIGQFTSSSIEVDGFETMTAASMKWARAATNAGAVAAGSLGTLNVIFDATVVSNFGEYTAELVLEGTFVNQLEPVPLKMTIPAGPFISAPSVLNFGEVVIGNATNVPLQIRNIGSGVLSGQITAVTAPFGIIGAESYAIPSGGTSTHTLSFAPSTEGVYSNVATLTGDGGATVTLTGTGIPEPTLWLVAFLLGMSQMRRRFEVRER